MISPDNHPTHESQAPLPIHTHCLGSLQRLFIGLRKPDGSPVERDAVLQRLSAQLHAFTVTEAMGYYQGAPEPSLVVAVAPDDATDLVALAKELADTFEQDAVGLELAGRYTRIFGKHAYSSTRLVEADRKQLNRFTKVINSEKISDEMDAELYAWWLNRY
jgi:ABC-type enterochelin transport system ATPase subunit